MLDQAMTAVRNVRDADLIPELKAEIKMLKEELDKLKAELAVFQQEPSKVCQCGGRMRVNDGLLETFKLEPKLGFNLFRLWECQSCGVLERFKALVLDEERREAEETRRQNAQWAHRDRPGFNETTGY